MLNINVINEAVDLLVKELSPPYDIFNKYSSVIVCGNGTNGYANNSAKFIDSHDLVVRINNYETIKNITGQKTDVLFAGASYNNHLSPDKFYPEINKFKTIMSSSNIVYTLRNKRKITNKHHIVLYSHKLLSDITKQIGYKSNFGISGIHCALLFLAIAKKFNSTINFIGFNIETKDTTKETYYYGIRDITNTSHLKHDWNFHSLFFKIIYDRFSS